MNQKWYFILYLEKVKMINKVLLIFIYISINIIILIINDIVKLLSYIISIVSNMLIFINLNINLIFKLKIIIL